MISEEYHDLIDVFEKWEADKLAPHHEEYDIKIELKSEKMLNFESLYNMSREELQVLQQYLNEQLEKKFI